MQSKQESNFEALLSTLVGFTVAVLAGYFIIFPIFGLKTSILDNIGITCFYTVLSYARIYLIRRFFAVRCGS